MKVKNAVVLLIRLRYFSRKVPGSVQTKRKLIGGGNLKEFKGQTASTQGIRMDEPDSRAEGRSIKLL